MILLLLSLALARDPAPPRAPIEDAPAGRDTRDPKARVEEQIAIVEGLLNARLSEQALQVISELRSQGVRDPRLDVLQGEALAARGMKAEALRTLEDAVAAHPKEPAAWKALGVLRADSGDLPGAIAAFERARKLAPQDADALNNLGYLQLASGHPSDAVPLFQAALRIDPSMVRARNNLGFALIRLDREEEARQAFAAAGPPADAQYNLGVAWEARGEIARAITAYEEALRLQPQHPQAGPALVRLLSSEAP